MKHCIIHKEFLPLLRDTRAILTQADLDRRNKITLAQLTIDELINSDKKVVDLTNEHPAKAAEFFEPGDEVMLYGCIKGGGV